MKLCFIDFKNKEILKKRLYERCLTDNSDYDSKLKVIEEYLAKNLAGNYEHIIYNDYSLDYTLKQIDKLVFSKEIILQ
jgi:guanylate kinase